MPITLTGRLLCASQHAYSIGGTSGVTRPSPATPAPPPSTLVGYLCDPPCFIAGGAGINAALVGETATEIIVAFRGTEPFDSPDRAQMVLDWANDLNAILVNDPDMPGAVHSGFLGALNGLWPLVSQQVGAKLQASPGKPLYLTGHSKGGAMASLAAMRCVRTFGGVTPYVCTFAAARPGDPAFATGYAAAVPHSTRYEFQDDIVPHLPPEDALIELLKKVPSFSTTAATLNPGYASVGMLAFINWEKQIVGDSPALQVERLGHLVSEMFALGGFDKIINDHPIDAGSGYASAICPGIWTQAVAA
ncbi:MAG: lipase family protein [Caulobacteraceae bacterium]